jgi:peroxiredoxin Q/BCP
MSAFRDRHPEFAGAEAQVLGISMDTLETQRSFADSLELPFPLLADPDGAVARAYGVAAEGYAKRFSFVIGKDGKIVAVFEGAEALDPNAALSTCQRRMP